MRKRLLQIYLAAVLAAAVMPVQYWAFDKNGEGLFCSEVYAAETTGAVKYVAEGGLGEQNSIHWKLDEDGVLTLSGTGAIESEKDYPWAAYGKKIVKILISEGIEEIGNKAFDGINSLTGVSLPESLKVIGEKSFSRCPELLNIRIPASVTAIGKNAFAHSGLLSVTFCGEAPEMGEELFDGISKLRILYPEGCSSWTADAMEKCSVRNCVWIPDSQTCGACGSKLTWSFADGILTIEGSGSMDDYQIDCGDGSLSLRYTYPWKEITRAITEIVVGDDVTEIGNMAFALCDQVTEVSLGESITSIGANAFNGCSAITEVRIPSAVTEIQQFAFSGCNHLEAIYCGENLETIEDNAFKGCAKLREVYYGADQSQWNKVRISYNGNNCLMTAKLTFNYLEDGEADSHQGLVEGTLRDLYHEYIK